ncbi:MAG: YcaQ family DNA glycosylase [Candidatus Thorarchaeota archaeon]|nr:YcaQ family DNA glycosylase [Candidatus Thorarchaeota archaeon]
MIEVSSDTARRFILDVQGLRTEKPSKSVMNVAKRIHSVQIDTMSVVSRSHNLIVYNRFPKYKEGEIWKYLESGKLFEYWSHALCLIPIENYPFYAKKMEHVRSTTKGYYQRFGVKMKDTVKKVYEYIKKNGVTSSSDFKGKSLGWGGSLESRSMQYLHYTGQIMIAFRKNFQKFYDLTERVLPTNIDSSPMNDLDLARFVVETTLGSLGLGNQQDIRTYLGRWPAQFLWKGRRPTIDRYMEELVSEGKLERVAIDSVKDHYYTLSKNVKHLMKTETATPEEPVKLLTPFDNIMRERHYPLNIWDFEYKLESYVPAIDRKYGYHILPILDGTNLVGRLDAKVYRNENRIEIISIFLEDDFWKEELGLERLIQGFKVFNQFHQVDEISIGKVSPEIAKNRIVRRLTD